MNERNKDSDLKPIEKFFLPHLLRNQEYVELFSKHQCTFFLVYTSYPVRHTSMDTF